MLSGFIIEQVLDSQLERLKKQEKGLFRNLTGFENLSTHAFIVTGIRRCGKSTAIQQIFRKHFKNSIYLNFEDPRLSGFELTDFNRLHEIAVKRKINAYFLDEVQLVNQWESFVRFRLDEGYRIFITGSNSDILSKELGSKLTGRHISKELFPFSYKEYLQFKKIKASTASFESYLETGGFPEYLKTNQPEVLMQCFNDIIIKDIAVRFNIKNTVLLKQLAVFLVSNIGKPITGNSLRKLFNIPSSSSIMEYLSYFSDAYMFFYVPRFSYSNKVQIVNPKKTYCIDNGFIKNNSISFSEDKGRLLENLVFIHLRLKTEEIFYFKENKECDFIVFKNGKLIDIIQVCYQVNESNIDREIDGISEAMNFFKIENATIITADQTDLLKRNNKNIHLIPFYKWANI